MVDLDRRGEERVHARFQEPFVQRGQVIDDQAHVGGADEPRFELDRARLGGEVLEELDVVAGAGRPNERHPHLRVRIADDRAEVAALPLALGEDLEAKDVAVEPDRAPKVADRETGVLEALDLSHAAPPSPRAARRRRQG